MSFNEEYGAANNKYTAYRIPSTDERFPLGKNPKMDAGAFAVSG